MSKEVVERMNTSGKIRIGLSISFVLLFIVILIPFIFRPNSNRWKQTSIEKNWNIALPKSSQVLYYKQSGFSFFGEGDYYTIFQIESELDLDEFHPMNIELKEEVENWYKHSNLEIDLEQKFPLDYPSLVNKKKKKENTCILLYDSTLKQLYVFQTFR